MDDKTLMEDLLNNCKGACDLYLHGTIESATPEVLDTFFDTLSDGLNMQGDIYKEMEDRGWYEKENATKTKVKQVMNKYCDTCCEN